MSKLKKDLDSRSFYDAVQALEGHTIISSLKGQNVDSILESIKANICSYVDSLRNDIKQMQPSDQIYNPLFLLKLWDLARNESANYFENRNKNECGLNYNPQGLEYLMWMLSLISSAWMIENLKGKIEVGSCHTHREITKKPCPLSSQFHKEFYDDYIKTVEKVLDYAKNNPPKLVV